MRIKKIYRFKRFFPVFHIVNDKYFERNIYECVKVFGPIVMTRENNSCGEKKLLGLRYAEQFYRSFIIGNILAKFSDKRRLKMEIRVHAEHLLLYKGTYLRKQVLAHARYIWAEKGFKDKVSVGYIEGRLLHRRLLLTRTQ